MYKRQILGLTEGLPTGAEVYLNDKSAYINRTLFFDFTKKKLVYYFYVFTESPILALHGHESYYTNPNLISFAAFLNGLCVLCLPPHTMAWLHPADCGFFGPLKKSYYDTCNSFMRVAYYRYKVTVIKIINFNMVQEAQFM